MSSFIIPAVNTGNVTQQRLQGNQNALDVATLQTQVTALQPSTTSGSNTYTASNRNFAQAYQNTGTSAMIVEFTVSVPGSSGGTASIFKGADPSSLTQTGASSCIAAFAGGANSMFTFVVLSKQYYKVTFDVNLTVQFVTETNL